MCRIGSWFYHKMAYDHDSELSRNRDGSKGYYVVSTCNDNYTKDILRWLEISPETLSNSTSNENDNDVIFYIQLGCGKASFEIDAVRNRISIEYPMMMNAKKIYILAMDINDDLDKHKNECRPPDTHTEGNITFCKIHCSCNGSIHPCRGNKDTKEFLRVDAHIPQNKCSLLKCALLFLFLPILMVIVLFISIAVSITTCKECLVRKKSSALYQWLILPLALFTVIVPSVVVSCVVCIVVLFRCLLRMVPVQADMIMENVYQWTNIIWKCICCISSAKTGSNQSILPK